jgi:hypothetical protein
MKMVGFQKSWRKGMVKNIHNVITLFSCKNKQTNKQTSKRTNRQTNLNSQVYLSHIPVFWPYFVMLIESKRVNNRYTHTYAHICTYICTYSYVHSLINSCITYIYSQTYVAYIYNYTGLRYIHTRILLYNTYVYIHIYTHLSLFLRTHAIIPFSSPSLFSQTLPLHRI